MNTPHTTLQRVTSKDGTTIAFDRLGDGPPIILVCGGSVDRMSNAGLAAVLAPDFTVFNYDRRGRGDSTDTAPCLLLSLALSAPRISGRCANCGTGYPSACSFRK